MTTFLVDSHESAAGPGSFWSALPIRLDMSSARAVDVAERCAAALEADPVQPADRAAILAVLAVAQSLTAPARAAATMAEAEALARQVDNAVTRLYVMFARYALDLSPESLSDRRVLAETILATLASDDCASVRPTVLPIGFFVYVGTLLEAGDIAGVDEALSPERQVDGLLAPMMDSRYALWFRCARATIEGRLIAAEEFADRAHHLAVADGDIDADAVRTGQIAIIRWMQGRISEMEPVFLHLRHADPDEPVWAASVAWIWWHQGRVQAARGLVDSLPPVSVWRRGRNWLAAVAIMAEVAAAVGSDALVDEVRRELEPFDGRLVPIGLGVSSWGMTSRPLALIAARQGRIHDAVAMYRAAIDTARRIGAQPWLAEAQVELAELLLDHDVPGEDPRGLVIEAVLACQQRGLSACAERAERLLERIDQSDPEGPSAGETAVGAADTTAARPVVTVLGEFSVTLPNGTVARWKSRRAQTLFKILLARRGAPLSRGTAIDLLWPGSDPTALRNRLAVALSAIRRVLDPERQYPPDEYVASTRETVRLRIDRLSIDVEEFFELATGARREAAGDPTARLRDVLARYTGDAFAEDPYEPWAEELRRQAHVAFFAAGHDVANQVTDVGDHAEAVDVYRRILAIEPYDQRAHDGLLAALEALGATKHLDEARDRRRRALAELGITDET